MGGGCCIGKATSSVTAMRSKRRSNMLTRRSRWCPARANRSTGACTQTELGRVLRLLGDSDFGSARLEQAVSRLRAALEATPRDIAPAAWAETQYRLGAVLWRLGQRQTGTNFLEQAVTALQAALQIRIQGTEPLQWAETENQLGLALVTLGQRERSTERLGTRSGNPSCRRSRFCTSGMAVHSTGRSPRTMSASRWRRSAAGNAMIVPERAIIAYRDALTVRNRDRVPLYWARTMDNLGLGTARPWRTRDWNGPARGGCRDLSRRA